MEKNIEYSVIVPVFDEAESLGELYDKLKQVFLNLEKSYEIIFIDDGSRDSSFQVMKDLHLQDRRIKAVRLRRNYGKSAALQAGFNIAKGDNIFTIDADLQDDPNEMPKLVETLNNDFDLVSGWKYKRKDSFNKVLASKIFNLLLRVFIGLKLHDINCGLKLYRKEVIEEINLYGDLYRFLPIFAYQRGFRVGEIKVNHHQRKHGKSKYSSKKFVSGFIDFLTIIMLTKYFKKPAHFFGKIGMALLVLGFVAGLYVSIIKFVTGNTGGRIPLLLFSILAIIIGIQFISMGLIGEIIVAQKKEDTYFIKEVLD